MTTESSVLSNGMKQPLAVHSFLIYIIVFAGYIVLSLLSDYVSQKPVMQLIWLITPSMGLILLPVLIFTYLKGFNLKETFHIKIPRFKVYLVSIMIIVSGLIIIGAINGLLTPLFKPYESPLKNLEIQLLSLADYNIWWLLLGTTLIPAICEELLFRGFILRGFMNSVGRTQAIIITALLFGSMHFLIPRIFITALIVILFGILLILTDSIIIPITGHFINNLAAMLILLKSRGVNPDSADMTVFPFYIIVIAAGFFTIGIYWLIRNKQTSAIANHNAFA